MIIKKINNNYYVNPFLELYTSNGVSSLKRKKIDSLIISWKKTNNFDKTIILLRKLETILNEPILLDKPSYIFLEKIWNILQSINRSDVSDKTLYSSFLKKINTYKIVEYHTYNNTVTKKNIFCGTSPTKIYSIIYFSGSYQKNDIIRVCRKSETVMFIKKNTQTTFTIGPFLNKVHLLEKNLTVLDKLSSETPVISFYESDINNVGINSYIETQCYISIIERMTNYLYQSSPLYNRAITLTQGNIISVSDFLPLY